MFFFLLFVASFLFFLSDIPSFYSCNALWTHALYCSDNLHLFRLDPVVTAVWHVSFDLFNFEHLCQTMGYASSIPNNLGSLWLKFLYSL
jgi:hypothetical protein